MNEIWKDIEGYEGYYKVSNHGKIMSLRKWKRASCPDEYILKPYVNNRGYCMVTLYKPSGKRKFLLHRLVANAFIPNPKNLPHINHIDENTQNNNADNLEWCTPLYNNCYGTAKYRRMITMSYPVQQRLINGSLLATYTSVEIASDITGISRNQILSCLRGASDSAGGFVWTKPEQKT